MFAWSNSKYELILLQIVFTSLLHYIRFSAFFAGIIQLFKKSTLHKKNKRQYLWFPFLLIIQSIISIFLMSAAVLFWKWRSIHWSTAKNFTLRKTLFPQVLAVANACVTSSSTSSFIFTFERSCQKFDSYLS